MLTHTNQQRRQNNLLVCPMKTPDFGHTLLLEQLMEITYTTFASLSGKGDNKEK